MLDKKHYKKSKNWSNETIFGFYKKSSTLPSVVWAEEPKNGLRFETGSSYDAVPTRSKLLTDGQSSCSTGQRQRNKSMKPKNM